MGAFAISVAASLAWGVSDFIGGMQTRRMHALAVLLVIEPVGLLVAAAILPFVGADVLSTEDLLLATAAGVFGVVALGSFYKAMAIGTMSVVAPICATAVVIPVVVGLARGEDPRPIQLAGVVVAMAAVALISYEEKSDERPQARQAIALAIVAALGIGFSLVAIDATAKHDVMWTIVMARFGAVAAVVVGVLAVRPKLAPAVGALPLLAGVGVIDTLANGLYAYSTTIGLLPLVAVGASLYPAFTILLAHRVLGERLLRLQWIGVATALLGVIMISAGS